MHCAVLINSSDTADSVTLIEEPDSNDKKSPLAKIEYHKQQLLQLLQKNCGADKETACSSPFAKK